MEVLWRGDRVYQIRGRTGTTVRAIKKLTFRTLPYPQ